MFVYTKSKMTLTFDSFDMLSIILKFKINCSKH